MKTFVRSAAVLCLAGFAACSDPFGGGRVPVRFTVTERAPAGDPEFTVESATPRTITVVGTFGFRPCDTPRPRATVNGPAVVFRLEMEVSSDSGCPAILQVRGYEAVISGVSAGTYHVVVEHVGTIDDYDGVDRADGVRFEDDVTVQ